MLTWKEVLAFADKGNPEPENKVRKSAEQWQQLLTPFQYKVARLKGTEPAFSSEVCNLFEPGRYACLCCGTELFDSQEKFQSGTGWPSFTQPIQENAIAYHVDRSHGMERVEVTCNVCEAHLGHVFPDGPQPSGLRYCINAVVIKKVTAGTKKAVFGGGCFWCTEAVFKEVPGVISVASGYCGGQVKNPSYREVCLGTTGHAEVIEIEYDPNQIAYEDLLRLHMVSHDPTTLNQQGADKGTQYRSVIFYQDEEQQRHAESVIKELQEQFEAPIVTEIAPLTTFYKAEDYHQDYFANNSDAPYCQFVIQPKLKKFREIISKISEN